MAKFKVVKPTTVMPEAAGLTYGEGDEFEVDERCKEMARWADVLLEEGVIVSVGKKAEPKVKTAEELKAAAEKGAEVKAKKEAAVKAKKAKAAADAKAKAEAKAKEETPKPNEGEGE